MSDNVKGIVLDRPDGRRIADAFRELPKKGTLQVLCDMPQLQETLRECEQAGFFALQIKLAPDYSTASISAWKGNVGPCFETGRSVRYRGGALAVLDDDHHFIFGSMRVCEKTGGIYRLPPYAAFLDVTAADPKLLARLETDPVPFNCNTFEKDSAGVIERLSDEIKGNGDDLCTVLYPGPFRLLVLDDGSVLRRGAPVKIPSKMAARLAKSDGVLIPGRRIAEAPVAGKYQELYSLHGAAGVLDEVVIKSAEHAPPVAMPELGNEVFVSCLPELREQLRRMIERNAPYVVFSGSDPEDPLGCCPSEQVGQANRLVAAGVLSKYAPPAPPDACTTTFFACAGEIQVVNGEPRFSVNRPFREKLGALLSQRGGGVSGRVALMRWLLMAMIVTGFAGASYKFVRRHCLGDQYEPQKVVSLIVGAEGRAGSVLVVMFRGTEDCGPCLEMRQHVEATIAKDFPGEVAAGGLWQKIVNYDDDVGVRRFLGVPVSTIGLFGLQGSGQGAKVRMLTEAVWALQGDDNAFRTMLAGEIRKMLQEVADAGGAGTTR